MSLNVIELLLSFAVGSAAGGFTDISANSFYDPASLDFKDREELNQLNSKKPDEYEAFMVTAVAVYMGNVGLSHERQVQRAGGNEISATFLLHSAIVLIDIYSRQETRSVAV